MPRKKRANTTFLKRNSKRSRINAVTDPSIILKIILINAIKKVFLNPTNKYLSPNTLSKFSKVILSSAGSSRGDVLIISPLVFRAANSVRRMGSTTMMTIPIQISCFAHWVIIFLDLPDVILFSSLSSDFQCFFRLGLADMKHSVLNHIDNYN